MNTKPLLHDDHDDSKEVEMNTVGRSMLPSRRYSENITTTTNTTTATNNNTRDASLRRRRTSASVSRHQAITQLFYKEEQDEAHYVGNVRELEMKSHALSHVHDMTANERVLMMSYESLDYDVPMNQVYRNARFHSDVDKQSIRRENMGRWIYFALTGIITGLVAFILSIVVEALSEWKFNEIEDDVRDGKLAVPFFKYLFISVGFVGVSTFLVAVVEPVAGGSGIPEIKAYLNGTNYLRFLQIKTGFVKIIGVCFSVAGGLIIGKEGPLVHTGAIIAANLCNATFFRNLPIWSARTRKWLETYRNDRDKRDCVAGGAAAGVAAAFGAPVGGILFSLEEAASFWNVRLLWYSFLAAMLATFTLNAFKIIRNGDDDYSGLISFGPPLTEAPFHILETPFFVLLAVVGGFLGAAFNHINERISHWRRERMVGRPIYRMVEAMTIAAVTAIFSFWAPFVFSSCRAFEDGKHQFYSSFRCSGDNEFNTMASVIFATTEKSIRGFFHNEAEYDPASLLAYAVIVFMLAVVTYGIAVPSGLFVPAILVGSSYGRLVGELLRQWLGSSIRPGTYAIIGATSMLGGISRMTLSLCVILLETTQDVQFIMPIMITLIVSKWVGDYYNISLYDLHVELKCFVFVEAEPSANMKHLTAGDIMIHPVTCIPQTCTVGDIINVLEHCTHNGFPVYNDENAFVGTILRNQLSVILNARAFGPAAEAVERIQLEDFNTDLLSKVIPLEPIDASLHDRTVTLTPFMNPSPISVNTDCPVNRVFSIFRALGTRHLAVLNLKHQVVGIITRKEIMTNFQSDLF